MMATPRMTGMILTGTTLNDADLIDYYIGYLDRYLGAGVPVFNCEYVLGNASTVYANALSEGCVPCVTRCSLSRLTATPPPGYASS